jgi:hypothetical protein
MRKLMLLCVMLSGCIVTGGVQGTVSNCMMEPGPEIAVGYQYPLIDASISGTYRSSGIYVGPAYAELRHYQTRAELAFRVPLNRRVWVGPLGGVSYVYWTQTYFADDSEWAWHWGGMLGLDSLGGTRTEIGVRQVFVGPYDPVWRWHARTGVRF